MSSFGKPLHMVLGGNTIGFVASRSTGSKVWIVTTAGTTVGISCVAYAMSLYARRIR